MKVVLRWALSNVPLLILALVLASLAWVVALEEEDPTRQDLYSQAIPVVALGQAEGTVIVGGFDVHVQVTIRAPQSVWDTLETGDFTATVDLTGLEAGGHQVPILVTLNKQPSQVMFIEPQYVTLELEPQMERSVSVQVQIAGEPAIGYLRQTMIVNPRMVTASGPGPYVDRVVRAAAGVSVQDAIADVEEELQLQPVDSAGQIVPHVTLLPATVRVRIPIELSGYYRPLAVKVALEGQVAPGYRITNISVEPPAVTVYGTPEVIAALPGFVETQPISLEGAQEDVIRQPALNIPSDVTLVPGQQQVEVKVSIEPIQSSLTMEIAPESQGLEPSLVANVSPETIEVILGGPLPVLETLQAGDVRVLLNLLGLTPGTYQIEPQVLSPTGLTVLSINPATVQVEIIAAPTPPSTPIGR
jgi:YbbR domain-containing protein